MIDITPITVKNSKYLVESSIFFILICISQQRYVKYADLPNNSY